MSRRVRFFVFVQLLSRLANDIGIVAILKKYEWRVGILGELPPTLETGIVGFSDHCLLGLNVNKGEKILLRLRTSPGTQFTCFTGTQFTCFKILLRLRTSRGTQFTCFAVLLALLVQTYKF